MKKKWTADKELNMEAIFAVMKTTWAVVKIRPEKIQACMGFGPMTLCNTGTKYHYWIKH